MDRNMRKKFESLVKDIKEAVALVDHPQRADRLQSAAFDVRWLKPARLVDPAKALQLVEAAAMVRGTTGNGRSAAEVDLMRALLKVAGACGEVLDAAGVRELADDRVASQVPAGAQPALAALGILCRYALDCFEFVRPRDSVSGERRSYAFEVLGFARRRRDLLKGYELACASLDKCKHREMPGACVFLRRFYHPRTEKPDHKMIRRLWDIADHPQRGWMRSCVLEVLDILDEPDDGDTAVAGEIPD